MTAEADVEKQQECHCTAAHCHACLACHFASDVLGPKNYCLLLYLWMLFVCQHDFIRMGILGPLNGLSWTEGGETLQKQYMTTIILSRFPAALATGAACPFWWCQATLKTITQKNIKSVMHICQCKHSWFIWSINYLYVSYNRICIILNNFSLRQAINQPPTSNH